MNKLIKYFQHCIRMSFVQSPIGNCMNLHVTRIAKRNQIFKAIVSLVHFFASSVIVNMMNMRAFIVAAFYALKAISLQCFKVVFISVFSHLFSKKRTFIRAIKLIQCSSRFCSITDNASKFRPAIRAMFLFTFLNRMKLSSTFSAWNCKQLLASLFVSCLTWFASSLKFMEHFKLSGANNTTFKFNVISHANIIAQLGSATKWQQ